jgi:hypothetical protein
VLAIKDGGGGQHRVDDSGVGEQSNYRMAGRCCAEHILSSFETKAWVCSTGSVS